MKTARNSSRWPPPRPAACSTCTLASSDPRSTTSAGQAGGAATRPAPAGSTTGAGLMVSRCGC